MTLDTLRAARDEARDEIITLDLERAWTNPKEVTKAIRDLDALLRLHAAVTTLENAEKAKALGDDARRQMLDPTPWYHTASFLRATVEGDTR